MDLRAELPTLLPLAIEWAEATSFEAENIGISLSPSGEEIARRVGVQYPERIRIVIVDQLPRPQHPAIRAAADATGLLGPDMTGITLGYSVFVRQGFDTIRLLSHEFRHVFQYEQAGSIASFLPTYLSQIVEVGYMEAPLEIDARSHEFDV